MACTVFARVRSFGFVVAVASWLAVGWSGPIAAQGLTPVDPAFWVTLPNGMVVPHNHPLATGSAKPAPAPARPSAPVPAPAPGRTLSPSDPGFWVTLPNGARVPYNHPDAGGSAGPVRVTPAPPRQAAPATSTLSPSDAAFWVTLPDGSRLPYNHSLALAANAGAAAGKPASPSQPAPARSQPAPAPAPAAPPPSTTPFPSPSGSALRVLHWNIHHGVRTDGVYDLDLLATWIVKTDPHVVSLNEVERFTGWGNEDQPARFAALLKGKTGKTWYYHFASRNGASSAQGNMWLSLYPIENKDSLLLSHNRSVAQIRITVNGRAVNLFTTHLDHESAGRRSTQMNELKRWVLGFPEQRIVAGDFNTWPSAGEITAMTGSYVDAWAEAAKAGSAVAYAGNNNGATRNSRIDYVFLSRGASQTVLKGAQVFDVRDSRGVMPSDHRPLLAVFDIR
jgi:endonuclease/exonuclease/phosphatase family metal-dependent hydrolase